MIFPRVERHPDGVVYEDLAPPFALMLLELPGLLAPDPSDEVKRRLFPHPSDDESIREDWERYVHPELWALLASAREIVTKDLGNLAASSSGVGHRLEIPAGHVNAWISALNAARLALGAIHGIEDEVDLHTFEDEDDEEPDERRIAIAKIHLLGELQALLVLNECPPPQDAEEEDDAS
ncbi:MAG: DUF2017 family protein [Planctomycetota bacterium]